VLLTVLYTISAESMSMLNWICPDCGQECSPTSRECPGCAEQARVSAEPTPAPTSVFALAKGIESAPSVNEAVPPVHHTSVLVEDPVIAEPIPQQPAEQEPAEPSGRTLDAFVENLEEQLSSNLPAATEVERVAEPLLEQPSQIDVKSNAPLDDERKSQEIGAIVESFSEQPRTLLLGAAAQAAPPQQQQYSAPPITAFFALARPFPAPPSENANQLPSAAPQPLLLPGPCLPPDLRNLRTNGSHTAPQGSKKFKPPAWLISLFAAMLLVLFAGSMLQNMSASREAKAASVPVEAGAQSSATPEAVVPSDAHPFGRYVEITGVRVVADPQRHSQLQYLVVNHSNIQITGIALHINVRSADPSSKAPLIQVSAVIPSLGAYESKEIRTDLDTQIRSSEIPDWDHLKVDVQITSR
jgi:hypothetical protein